ncbi:MAG: hypothetical protein WC523_03675 [Patescibacteria group bacterium]
MLEDVHNITRAAYEQYPEDPVIGQVAFTIERIAAKAPKGSTISQAEVSNIYNNFVRLSSNSHFREVLGSLLFDVTTPNVENADYSRLNRVDAEDSKAIATEANAELTNTISSVFSDSVDSSKSFDIKIASDGLGFVSAELKSLGFSPAIEIMGGNKSNIVYAAHFNTNRGRITVAIPTQIVSGRVLFPSTFVAGDRLEELTSAVLSMFIDKKAQLGDFSIPKTANVLSALNILAGQKYMSEPEFAKVSGTVSENDDTTGLSLEDKKDTRPELPTNQIAMDNTLISSRKADMPQSLAHLARDFEDDVLEAASTYGLDSIRKGKEMIALELRTAGFKNAQVRFGSESNQTVVYLASINTPKGSVELEVPVEMAVIAENKYMPLSPSFFAYDGMVEDFTASKLQRFAIRLPSLSTGSTVCSSSFSYMLLPELKDEILKAASENDYVTCEAALSEIKNRFNEDDLKNAISDYHFILTQKTKMNKQSQHKCSRLIKAGHGSISDRCGHYLCSLDKVITDENGNCRLKTAIEREKLNPIEDGGALISTSKINLT